VCRNTTGDFARGPGVYKLVGSRQIVSVATACRLLPDPN
jgi:hypothetical protein